MAAKNRIKLQIANSSFSNSLLVEISAVLNDYNKSKKSENMHALYNSAELYFCTLQSFAEFF